MKQIANAVVALLMCCISGAANAGSLASYANDQYYLGAGGTPPALHDFAANPRAYLRSDTAYRSLKNGFVLKLGTDLSDVEFQTLLQSDQVRLVACIGRIHTAGISQQGLIGWSSRACYVGEQLIELNVNGKWVVVASQGCFNLVRPMPVPVVVKPAPPVTRTIIVPQAPTVLWSQGPHVPLANCPTDGSHNHIKLPDTFLQINRNPVVIKEFITPQQMN